MKYYLLLLFYTCICTILSAQTPRIKVTKTTIVKDSTGMVYPYLIWSSLMRTGDYDMQPIDKQNEKTDFYLVKLTDLQKLQRLEKMPKPGESESFRTGKEFSFFKTSDINNNKINLKEEKGKIIVLNFWFINCPPCRMEIPALNELVASFKGNDSIRFIGIALDAKSDLREFLKTMPFNYAIVDNGRFLSERFRIRSYPTHVIIDQEGKVYFHTTGLGMNTVFWLKKSITELLNHSSLAQQ